LLGLLDYGRKQRLKNTPILIGSQGEIYLRFRETAGEPGLRACKMAVVATAYKLIRVMLTMLTNRTLFNATMN
jgi:hypothetical protein